MNGWAGLTFLGLIALATVVTAGIQVGFIVYAARLARRVERLAERVEREIQPLVANLNAASGKALEASALAVAQVERADRLFADVATRADQAAAALQAAVVAPVREARALLAGLGAGFAAFRELRQEARARAGRADEDEALFIG